MTLKPMLVHNYNKNVTAPNNNNFDSLDEMGNNICMEYIQTVKEKGKTSQCNWRCLMRSLPENFAT